MDIPTIDQLPPNESKSDSSLTTSTELSDLSLSPPASIKKVASSPILSNLPHIYNNLRSNDGKRLSGSEGTSSKTSFFKKMLNVNRSSEELNTSSNPLPPLHTSTSIFSNALGKKRLSIDDNINERRNSLSPVLDASLLEGDLHVLDLNSGFFKNKDQYKIPSVFLKEGLPLLKLSHKSRKRIYFRFDPADLKFSWKSALNSASMLSSTSRLILPSTSNSSKNKTTDFFVDDIKLISYQEDASNYREELHALKEFESQWLSVIYFDHNKGKMKTLHVIADTEKDFKKLVSVIEIAKKLRDDLAKNFFMDVKAMEEMKRSILTVKTEEERDKQPKETLSFNDILKYLKRLNININTNHLRKIFQQILESSSDANEAGLNFDQFKEFVSVLKQRNDITKLWNDFEYSSKNIMTYFDFKKCIAEVQKETHSEDYLSKIFKKFCVESNDFWLPENFNNYLLSKYSLPLRNINNESYFESPLNEYFISSSHNTYLLGRQVAGASSVEGYIKVLQRGCRCVEVDVWDGHLENEDGSIENVSEPIVSHGRTFTSEISFINVIRTIKKYAFISSPYPLIISLEINCSVSNQLKLVKILHDILADTLVHQRLFGEQLLPSPMQLKHKILLKVKKTSPFINLVSDDAGNYTPSMLSTSNSTTTSFSEDSTNNTSTRRGSFSIRRKNKGIKIADELSDLGIYLQGLKFKNFSLPESKTYNHCFSLSEKSINSMLKDDVKQASVDKHNRRYFMRVYPSKIRLKSSNFNPINYWSNGVQMVATNWQTYDLGQQINEAAFEVVNKKGYVLKPPSLRKPLLKSERNISTGIKKTKFLIEVISAHQLPKPKNTESAINPFVSFEILGANDIIWDAKSCISKSHIVAENGFNPIWNSTFSGIIMSDHDLIFVRLLINCSSSFEYEDDMHTIGLLVSRLSDMNMGYRYHPISDLSGEELVYSSLFLKVSYDDTH